MKPAPFWHLGRAAHMLGVHQAKGFESSPMRH